MTYYFIWDKKEKRYIGVFVIPVKAYLKRVDANNEVRRLNKHYGRGRFKVVAIELPDGG